MNPSRPKSARKVDDIRLSPPPPPEKTWKFHLSMMLVLTLFTVAARLPYINTPLERDEGEYAYIAWRTDQGELPYRDVFDQKPPGVFVIYLLTMKLLGGSIADFHLAGMLFAATEVLLLYLLALRWVRPWIAALSAGLCAWVISGCVIQGYTSNTETFAGPFIVLTALLAMLGRDRRRGWLFFLSGLSAGIGSLMKQPVVLFGLIPLAVALTQSRGPGGARLKGALLTLTGMCVPWVPVVVYFWARGGLADMLYCVLLHNLEYSRSVSPDLIQLRLWQCVKEIGGGYGLPIAVGVYGIVVRLRERRGGWEPALWAVVSMVAVTFGWQFFFHYYLMAAPAFALLAGLGMEEAWKRLSEEPGRTVVLVTLLAAVIVPPVATEMRYLPLALKDVRFVSNKFYQQGYLFTVSPRVGEICAQLSRPDEPIFLYGSEPQIAYYARRRNVTRHILFDPVFGPYRRGIEFQEEVMRELDEQHPPVVVTVRLSGSLMTRPETDRRLHEHLATLLPARYLAVAGIDVLIDPPDEPVYYLGAQAVSRRTRELNLEAERLVRSGVPVNDATMWVELSSPTVLIWLRSDLQTRQPAEWKVSDR